MAIDIPPPMPPIQADVRSIEAAKAQARGVVKTGFADYQVEIVGPALLSKARIDAVMSRAKNPSQAVLGLNNAYYSQGHLLVGLHFALVGKKLSIYVVQGKLANVVTPPALNQFFKPLIGDTDLTFGEFDRRRLLADIKASRAGEQVSVSYRRASADPADITMVLTAKSLADYQATTASFQIGNPGSRFLGRYFQQSQLRHTTDYGTEVAFGYESALTSLGDDPRGGKSYDHLQLALDHPTRFGVYGFDISHIVYTQEVLVDDSGTLREFDFKSKITQLGLNGKQVLVSSARNRFNTYQRIEHIESEFENEDEPQAQDRLLLDEPHTSVEFGLTWFHRFPKGTTFNADLSGEWGVSSDGDNNAGTLNTLAAASPRELDSRRRTSQFRLIKPKLGLAIPVFKGGNLSFDFIGQFAGDHQVPQEQQWVLGGTGSLSAYLSGLLVGDSGYYGRVVLNLGRFGGDGISVVPSLFVEHGVAEFEDAEAVKDSSGNLSVASASGSILDVGEAQSVTDAGIRLQFDIAWDIDLELVVARNVADDNLSQAYLRNNEADFFFNLKKSI